MAKRIPVIPTLLVLAAVAVMVRLGFWQLDRLEEKEGMIAQFESALKDPPSGVDLNRNQLIDYPEAYSPARVTCVQSGPDRPTAGRNAAGQVGWAHVFACSYRSPRGVMAQVEVVGGWSAAPGAVSWPGGEVTGLIIPESMNDRLAWRILADPPLAGLQANARPDPKNVPNNHLSYAIQWFLFALVALVIYGLALRKRLSA